MISRKDIPPHLVPVCILVSFVLILAAQGLLLEVFWWQLSYDSLQGLGWKLGFIYALFCIFISGVHLLSAHMEDPSLLARRWGCRDMEQMPDPGAVVCTKVLSELMPLRGGAKPALFYVPADEINAFAFNVNGKGALFITRGAITHLSRYELSVLLTRALLHLKDPRIKSQLLIALSIIGLSQIFFSGSNLLRHANLGRFETRPEKKTGHPLYFIGLIPLFLGLPGWWMSRLYLLWIDPSYVYELDNQAAQTPENRRELCLVLEKIRSRALDDCPTTLWPIRSIGLHHEGFLETLWPLQPKLEERLKRLKSLVYEGRSHQEV